MKFSLGGSKMSTLIIFTTDCRHLSRKIQLQGPFIQNDSTKRLFTTQTLTSGKNFDLFSKRRHGFESYFFPWREKQRRLLKKTSNISNRQYMSTETYQMEQKKEINIDSDLVRRLIDKQFPQWKDLYVKPVEVGGWDNRTFHLGTEMLVRVPSAEEYASNVEKEQTWLPRLAPLLPLSIPTPLAMGEPGENYPWKWSVYRWIEGKTAAFTPIADMDDFATRLARFLIVLQHIDTKEAPLPRLGDFSYVGGLIAYDDETRRAITALKSKIDARAAIEVWEKALKTTWQRPPVWVHGDISSGNLLVEKGKLSAVLDFEGLAIGDPACDLVIAWKFFQGKNRKIFREMLPLDPGTWDRGRAWALWKAMIVAAGLTESNTVEISQAWHTIEEVIKDFKSES